MAEEKPKKPRKKSAKPKKNPGAKPVGRASIWEKIDMPSKLKMVEGWAKNGSTNNEIAEMLGISRDLFYNWQKREPSFAEAIKKGKYESNGEILQASFKTATGYYQPVTEPFKVKTLKQFEEANGKKFWDEVEEIVDHSYMKYFPPNTSMQIFMLKNRLPLEYKDKHDIDHSGDMSINIQVDYGEDE